MLNTAINIAKYCHQNRVGKLLVSVSDLPDIVECQHDFELHYEFLLENKRYVLQLGFACVLLLRCQSCWQEYEFPIEVKSRLVLTTDSSEETHNELVALGYDVVIIEESKYTTISEIIKEEIFLQIPHIPRCDLHNENGKGVQLVIDEKGTYTKILADDEQENISATEGKGSKDAKNMPFQDLLKSLKEE